MAWDKATQGTSCLESREEDQPGLSPAVIMQRLQETSSCPAVWRRETLRIQKSLRTSKTLPAGLDSLQHWLLMTTVTDFQLTQWGHSRPRKFQPPFLPIPPPQPQSQKTKMAPNPRIPTQLKLSTSFVSPLRKKKKNLLFVNRSPNPISVFGTYDW